MATSPRLTSPTLPGRLTCTLALAYMDQAAASQVVEHRYTILRGNSEVGARAVRREVPAGRTLIRSSSRIDVRLLGLDIYRFRYNAQEVWDQAGLARLEVRVGDDGTAFRLDGRRDGSEIRYLRATGDARAGL
jgi:hypothetical protein